MVFFLSQLHVRSKIITNQNSTLLKLHQLNKKVQSQEKEIQNLQDTLIQLEKKIKGNKKCSQI